MTVESGLDRGLASKVERAALAALATTGIDPPPTRVLRRQLGLSSAHDPPTAEQCVASGRILDLDVVAVLRVRPAEGDEVEVEVRVVVVETGDEHRYFLAAGAARIPAEVGQFLTGLFGSVRAWEGDLVAVERALDRDRDSAYGRFLRRRDGQDTAFAEWAYDEAARRQTASLALGISIPIVLAGATVSLGIATRGIWQEREDSPYAPFLIYSVTFTRGWTALGLIIGTAGTIAAPLIAGWRYRVHEEDMHRLRPLLPGEAASPAPVSWSVAPSVLPGGAGLELTFRL